MTSALDVEEIMVVDKDYLPTPDLQQLQQELADEAARSDIECHCLRDDATMLYDLNSVKDDDREWVDRALRYLELRGLVAREGARVRLLP